MSPIVAFPIMMGAADACGRHPFVRAKRYDPPAAWGLALGGLPAVLIAAYVVKSIPLFWLRWLVVTVVLYAAVSMLQSAWKGVKA